jgi:hypothetical protein
LSIFGPVGGSPARPARDEGLTLNIIPDLRCRGRPSSFAVAGKLQNLPF